MSLVPTASERRLTSLTTVVPYVLLALLAVFADPVGRLLCGLAALWILTLYTVHPPWRARPRVMGVFLAGLLLIFLVLVLRDPWFGVCSAVGYVYAFRIIGWPAELWFIAGAGVVAGTAQANGIDLGTPGGLAAWAAVVAVNVAPMCGLAWLLQTMARHQREREAALAEARDANQRLATAMAENAALHQQLLTQARAAGVQDERRRMAREIHDTLAQGLIGVVTQLQAAGAADEPAVWRRHHDSAIDLARESLTEARRSVHALRPEPLASGRLDDALAEVAARWSERHGVTAEFTTTGAARRLPPAAEDALLRTAQEALANAARHAAATRVGVTLSYLDHDVALDVRDDGRGFDPAGRPAAAGSAAGSEAGSEAGGGFGLVAMRQRIESVSGRLQVESEPGGGTAISACVPA